MIFIVIWIFGLLGFVAFAFWQGARALRTGVANGTLGWKPIKRADSPALYWLGTIWPFVIGCGGLAMLAFALQAINWSLIR